MWKDLVADFNLADAGALTLLAQALDAAQRAREARETIAREGMVVADRFGQPKPHPAAAIENQARQTMIAAFKVLGLGAPSKESE